MPKPNISIYSYGLWHYSTIRSWLNGYGPYHNTLSIDFTSDNFIHSAFTAEEIAKIISTNITEDDNSDMDKIFFLSYTETKYYFTDDASRRAEATPYAAKLSIEIVGYESNTYYSNGKCKDVHCYAEWWTRSKTSYGNYYSGYQINPQDTNAICHFEMSGVRPAMWINY